MNDDALPALLSHPRFVVSAHHPDQWPADGGAEVVFAGRSNVGKSSALNVLTRRKDLARTSKTPGRTQQIIFFALNGDRHLVDLPGYGYAKVPARLQRHWEQVITRYLANRRALNGVILLMDARRPLTELDQLMLDLCTHHHRPVHILLTKSDKLTRAKAAAALKGAQEVVDTIVTVQLFSAAEHSGVVEARTQIVDWLTDP